MIDIISKSHRDFIKSEIDSWIDCDYLINPSEYVEKVRYMEKDITPIPGYYNFDNTPYWKEPLDMLSALSSVQKVVIVKGVQIGFTTGVLENILAYNIGCNPNPVLYITADDELLKTRFSIHTERLIDSCGLRHLIFSQSGSKTKKTGDTAVKKEYKGGYLIGTGAGNPNKLRSMSFPIVLIDELDAFKDVLKKEGSPESIAENRTNSFGEKRKILYGSTPLVLQTSKIWNLYTKGDMREYQVPCVHCGEYQVLRWHGTKEDGSKFGIVFEIDNGEPVYDTVGYKCFYCGKIMKNHHKSVFLREGKWVPQKKSTEPGLISYQISALYSAPGMFSWSQIVMKWKDCWDLVNNRVKDKEKYREFRNLMQGLPYEERGEQIRLEKVKQNRSYHYLKNHINNKQALIDSGSEILLLTASVDVQKNNLFVHIIGWAYGGKSYTVDFRRIDGIVEDYNSNVWSDLDKLLADQVWLSDDNREYRIINTFIDSGKYTQFIYEFCKRYSSGVVAIKGDEYINGGLTYRQFGKDTLERIGLSVALHINTTKLKDFIAKMFNFQWNTGEMQPDWYPNFPNDLGDDFFRMFTAENRVDEYDKTTNKFLRTRWRLTPNAENHAMDTMAYNLACIEYIADYICRSDLNLKYLDWKLFWDFAKTGIFYQNNLT